MNTNTTTRIRTSLFAATVAVVACVATAAPASANHAREGAGQSGTVSVLGVVRRAHGRPRRRHPGPVRRATPAPRPAHLRRCVNQPPPDGRAAHDTRRGPLCCSRARCRTATLTPCHAGSTTGAGRSRTRSTRGPWPIASTTCSSTTPSTPGIAPSSRRGTCSSWPRPMPRAGRPARTRAASPASSACSTSTRSPSRTTTGTACTSRRGNVLVDPRRRHAVHRPRARPPDAARRGRRASTSTTRCWPSTRRRSSSSGSAPGPSTRTARATSTATSSSGGRASSRSEDCLTPVPEWKRSDWAVDALPAGDPARDPGEREVLGR